MTREEARRAAEVMIAFAEGKRIESRENQSRFWLSCPNPVWQWDAREYRVAPEPWTGKIWVHPEGSVHEGPFFTLSDQEALRQGWRLITAKEVADE